VIEYCKIKSETICNRRVKTVDEELEELNR